MSESEESFKVNLIVVLKRATKRKNKKFRPDISFEIITSIKAALNWHLEYLTRGRRFH